jgi:glycosyltransferase involved in cell wall biosynthesis
VEYRDFVSVIVPTYNRAASVVKAVESVLRQSHPRLEVVVVNDLSTDSTLNVLRTLQQRDARVVCLENASAKGCAGARATGVSAATGDYVAFLDDDDAYLPDKIQRDIDIFRNNPEIDVVVSGVPSAWASSGNRGDDWISLEFRPYQVFDANHVTCKRSVLKNIEVRWGYMEWRDFAFQVYDKGYSVCLSSADCVQRDSTIGSMSKHEEIMLTSALANARRYFELSRTKREHPIFRRYLAICHKNIGNYSLKRGRMWQAIRGYANSYRVERKKRNLIPFV